MDQKSSSNDNSSIKKLGKVYTPPFIIKKILDSAGYQGKSILQKHVIDNSAGNGEFLIEFINRYVKAFLNEHQLKIPISLSHQQLLVTELETYVHGIEIEKSTIQEIEERIEKMLKFQKFSLFPTIKIINDDCLYVTEFDGKMDYVFGNPPYVRRRNLSNKDVEIAKKQNFKGMIDLYVLFFFKGREMLSEGGVLGYISPNSFFYTASGLPLREMLINDVELKKLINLGHNNPFNNADTYTAITIFKNCHPKNSYKFDYYQVGKEKTTILVDPENKEYFEKQFYFSNNKEFLAITNYPSARKNKIRIKNGASSNADWFFYNDNYQGAFIKSAYKASTSQYKKVFFPYDENANLVNLGEIEEHNQEIFLKLQKNKNKLCNRSLQKREWYEFARSQGLKDFCSDLYTLSVNNLVKEKDDLKIEIVKAKTIVYSGYYTQSDDIKVLKNIAASLKTDHFVSYVRELNKHKSGGFYTFSSVDLERYLNYQFFYK